MCYRADRIIFFDVLSGVARGWSPGDDGVCVDKCYWNDYLLFRGVYWVSIDVYGRPTLVFGVADDARGRGFRGVALDFGAG